MPRDKLEIVNEIQQRLIELVESMGGYAYSQEDPRINELFVQLQHRSSDIVANAAKAPVWSHSSQTR